MHEDVAAFARRLVAGRNLHAGAFPDDVWREMGDAGLCRIGLDDGNGYAAIATAGALLNEHGGAPGLTMAWAVRQMAARFFLMGFGDPAQRAAYLPDVAAGRMTIAVAISEPQAGAHPKHLRTTARRVGDEYRLDGEKAWISNGPIADLYVVLAITEETGGRKRYSAFLVPRDAPGLTRLATPPMEALHPCLHCGLRLESCQVPAAARLGPEGGAYEAMALPFRDVEDAVGGSLLLGALRYLLRRVADRRAEGATEADAATLGAAASLLAVLAHGARAVTPLDPASSHHAQATILGTRLLAAELLDRVQRLGALAGLDDDAPFGAACAALQTSLHVAGRARLARQTRIGMTLLQHATLP